MNNIEFKKTPTDEDIKVNIFKKLSAKCIL